MNAPLPAHLSAPHPKCRWIKHSAWGIVLAVCSGSLHAQAIDSRGPSHDDVQAYLTAKGMGMARAAERDGIPGPFHVLAMAHELGLSDAQLRRTQDVFATMETQSSLLGRQIIEQERALDLQFSDPRSSARAREVALARVGQLHNALRQVHQTAHEAQRSILTQDQVARYRTLRVQAAAVAQRLPAVVQAAGNTDR